MGRLWEAGTEKKEQDRGVSAASGNAEEAFEVAAADLEEVSGVEAEGPKKAFRVARKVERKVAGSGRCNANKGKIL
jgi:hypothetical protein